MPGRRSEQLEGLSVSRKATFREVVMSMKMKFVGNNGQIEAFEDRLVITRKSMIGFLTQPST